MTRIYIIIATVVIIFMMWVIMMWVNSSNATASILKPTKETVTIADVNEKLTPYTNCISKFMYHAKEVENARMSDKRASLMTLEIVKKCDQHLEVVAKWLFGKGYEKQGLVDWGDRVRQKMLDKTFNYLSTGMLADRKGDSKEGNSHTNPK